MKKIFLGLLLFIFPSVMMAQQSNQQIQTTTTNGDLFQNIVAWVNNITIILFLIVVLAFTIGIVRYVFDSDKSPEKFNTWITWPLIAIVILASLWGVIRLLQTTLGLNDGQGTQDVNIPTLNVTG